MRFIGVLIVDLLMLPFVLLMVLAGLVAAFLAFIKEKFNGKA